MTQALVPELTAVDFRYQVIEDRAEFCRPELFPGVERFSPRILNRRCPSVPRPRRELP